MVVYLVYVPVQYVLAQASNNTIPRLKLQSTQTSTYQIKAVFEGAGFKTSNLTVEDPYGRAYAVCTTLQWDFKSSSNSVTLTVEAPKTDATVSEPASPEDDVTVTQTPESTIVAAPPPKTPEQMEQEAEESGWLTIWHQFLPIWEYPWYRLHLNFTINGATMDIGFNPALPGGETLEHRGLASVIPPITPNSSISAEEMSRVTGSIVNKAIFGVLTAGVIAVAAANLRFLPSTGVAILAYSVGSAILFGIGFQTFYSNETSAHTRAKIYFTGLLVSYLAMAVATLMPLQSAMIFKVFISGILSIILANLITPISLEANLMSLYYGSLTALCIGLAALLLPEPNGIYFRPAFMSASLIGAIAAILTLIAWRTA
jgi:hypothetical protein